MNEQINGKIMEAPEMAGLYKTEEEKEKRTHRVGTITCGLVLVFYGILFLLRTVFPFLELGMIFEFWPIVLVLLGLEILIGCTGKRAQMRTFKYDFGSILIILVMMGFSLIMAAVDYGMYYAGY
ncbi:MAG: hypothetical protein HFI51_03365 [Lachnospiraceae bacterium]|nr:hypothetical protein [Lachnospiraceae bacterium]